MILTKQLATVAFVLWFVSQGGIASGETIIGSEYLPVKDGYSWTYQNTGPFGTYIETTDILPGTKIVNGIPTKIAEDSDGGITYVTSDLSGVRLHGFYFPTDGSVYLEPPLTYLKGTVSIPETSTSTGRAEFISASSGTAYINYTYRYTVEGKEIVTVPAGTYQTVRIGTEFRLFGDLFGSFYDETVVGTDWQARYIGNIKEVWTDSDGTTESVLISTNVKPRVDLGGTIKTPDGTDICAMVLASGRYMFSCNPPGVFSLTGLLRETDGTVKRQIYAHGFFPKIDVLPDSTNEAVVMSRSGVCPDYNVPYQAAFVPGSAGKEIYITGKVLLQNSETPICAMVLANGQYMFSCDGTGSYFLQIPMDNNGQFKLQVYADGFAPSIRTFDEFKTTNTVRLARAVECQ
jgi:hypothetical protein